MTCDPHDDPTGDGQDDPGRGELDGTHGHVGSNGARSEPARPRNGASVHGRPGHAGTSIVRVPIPDHDPFTMTGDLHRRGVFDHAPVAAAVTDTAREPFFPQVSRSRAYDPDGPAPDGPGAADPDDAGRAVRLARPWVAAALCDLLRPRRGQHVLCIAYAPTSGVPFGDGSDTAGAHAYLAALLAHQVGEHGTVTVAADHPDLAVAVRALHATTSVGTAHEADRGAAGRAGTGPLPAAGVPGTVIVLHTDPDRPPMAGPRPAGPFRPYDRIVCPTTLSGVPRRWADALAPDGTLTAVLRVQGRTCHALAFGHDYAGRWRAHRGRPLPPDPADDLFRRVALTDDAAATIDVYPDQHGPTDAPDDPTDALVAHVADSARSGLLTGRARRTRPGVIVTADQLATLELWLAVTLPGGLSTLRFTPAALDSGVLVDPLHTEHAPRQVLARTAPGAVAYLTAHPNRRTERRPPDREPIPDDQPTSVGVTAHGEHGRALGHELGRAISEWEHRRPILTFTLAAAAPPSRAGRVVLPTDTHYLVVDQDTRA